MIKGYKIMLHPNRKQETILWQYTKAARFVYNWALGREKEQYENGMKFLNDCELRRELTRLKKTPEYAWLADIDCDVTKQAVKDAVKAYKNFFKGLAKHPRFKSVRHTKPSFYQDPVKLQVSKQHVKLVLVTGKGKAASRRAKIFDRVKLAEKNRIPVNATYKNPRVSFDGLHWWISVCVETNVPDSDTPVSDGIGIDLGVKELAVCSDGTVIPNINKEEKLQKLYKHKKHLERLIVRKYENNKKGTGYRKTKNIVKSEKKLRKIYQRIKHIQDDHMRKAIKHILSKHPAFIGLEDLNVNGMLKKLQTGKSHTGREI